MIDELADKIDCLIAECPSDWATQVAEIMGITKSGVYMIKTQQRTRRGASRLVELIEALKQVRDQYHESIKKALV